MAKLYCILLDNGTKYIAYANDTLNLQEGDMCIIRKDFYFDYGDILYEIGRFPSGAKKSDYPRIERKATVRDKGKVNENKMRAKSALRTCAKFVEELNLSMKLINSHYSFDTKYVNIQFAADGRVDFRELVKKLSQALSARIELRQIGVRDEAAIIGGIGICGCEICCKRFLKKFASINVKMAKEQDLSLNPATISGLCGRLKCCLKYEYEGYKELQKNMPSIGDICETKEGRGKIVDRNLLTQTVAVTLDSTGITITCKRDEIKIIDSRAKRKKNGSVSADSEEINIELLDEEMKKILQEE